MAEKRPQAHLRVASREPVRYSFERSIPALQWAGKRLGQVFCRNQRAFHDEPVSQSQFHFRQQLHLWKERGAGGRHVNFDLAGNVMGSHISEFPVGRYKKAHRHGPGAHVTILSGQGYSLLWPEHGEPTRVDWKPGSVVVPPSQWFHQHFNSGADPARYLALRWNSWRYNFVALGDDKPIEVSVKDGGTQIEYEDEDPKIHEFFESCLHKAGARCRMGSMVPWCTEKGEE